MTAIMGSIFKQRLEFCQYVDLSEKRADYCQKVIYRGVRMKDETEKKKAQRDVLKAVCIASGTILLIAGIIVVARKVGIR